MENCWAGAASCRHGADGKGRVRLEYRVPARGLIGFQGEFLT
jgi:predicted membrane GTPase involved in stress response